jgi:hypothetical protein
MYIVISTRRYVHNRDAWSVDHYGPFETHMEASAYAEAWSNLWRDEEGRATVEHVLSPAPSVMAWEIKRSVARVDVDAFDCLSNAYHEAKFAD